MNILKKALGALAGNIPIVGGLVKDLIEKVDGLPPAEQAKLDAELAQVELEHFKAALADSADLRKLAIAELSVDDSFIRRVRPGILAGLFGIIVFWVVIVPLLNAIPGVAISPPDMSQLPEEIWWTFGSSYLGYGVFREIGKTQKLKHLGK